MSITVDDRALEVGALGFSTVGEVLDHVAEGDGVGGGRLVVQVLIDGEEPDLGRLGEVRRQSLAGRTVYIETVRPGEIAGEVLAGVEAGLGEAEGLRQTAARLFREGDAAGAMQALSGCFPHWLYAQESVAKVGQLLRADLTAIKTSRGTGEAVVAEFARQLRELKDALEQRDYVLCCDVLTYDMEKTREEWGELTGALRKVAGG